MANDSIEVRMAVAERIKRGEITLEQGQREIRRLVRKAKERGEETYFDQYRDDGNT